MITTGGSAVYEFNQGYSLEVPTTAAAEIQDGDVFTIEDAAAGIVTYEFDDGLIHSPRTVG